MNEDREQARRAAAAIVAFNSTVKTYGVIHAHHGFEPRGGRDPRRLEGGDWEAMTGAVSDQMIDTIALAGTADEVRAGYAERRADLFERVLLWPPAFRGLDGARAVIDAFAD